MWLERVKRFYEQGLWTKDMVGDAVRAGRITEQEYEEITEEEYAA